ncbi:zinc ribbon domain-containing protein [Aureivirga marina]|uniref:zinc ribbon domain-containing protein n=1 Tax=Aureivirga marina TaxID=1182451 RepID=UPI0018CBD4BA|nr:hypothetical protein [Aureivirga marina]
MAKTKEVTVEEKLRALYDLQLIDSRIDEIRSMRGELPLEIEDLEDEIAGLDTRISRFKDDISNFETEISNKNIAIEESKALVKKYKDQQKNVRNNREYDSLTKEAEFQELEIELAQKRIKEFKAKIEQKKEVIKKTENDLSKLTDHLNHKKAELDGIMAETHKEEEILGQKSEEYSQLIDEKLLNAYNRIRNKMKNGLAVVSIERGASKGSFFKIPPQRQAEIAARKSIIVDEHSGRILVDAHLAAEEMEKISSLFTV